MIIMELASHTNWNGIIMRKEQTIDMLHEILKMNAFELSNIIGKIVERKIKSKEITTIHGLQKEFYGEPLWRAIRLSEKDYLFEFKKGEINIDDVDYPIMNTSFKFPTINVDENTRIEEVIEHLTEKDYIFFNKKNKLGVITVSDVTNYLFRSEEHTSELQSH